jgi:predicted nucleotide-binding protein
MKPTIFIGSSSEALSVAKTVKAKLSHDADVNPWNQGVFPLSTTTIHSLLGAIRHHDYAVGTIFWHHDKAKMVTTDFVLKKPVS